MEQRLAQKTLAQLASENYKFAEILHSFGISFYQNPSDTLYNSCSLRKLNTRRVVRRLLSVSVEATEDLSLKDLEAVSLGNLVSYLKHTHRIFLSHKLPYMAKLIADICPKHFDQPEIAADLKIIFPLFLEEFIGHIHEEEDTTFDYILRLIEATDRHISPELYLAAQNFSLQASAEEHAKDDDEMLGIRQLTSNYAVNADTGVYTRVVYSELQSFEEQLRKHSGVENDILFPKALEVEKKLKQKMSLQAKMN